MNSTLQQVVKIGDSVASFVVFVLRVSVRLEHPPRRCGNAFVLSGLMTDASSCGPSCLPLALSQLFMVPEFRQGVLAFRDSEESSEDGLMWHLQSLFSHLQVCMYDALRSGCIF